MAYDDQPSIPCAVYSEGSFFGELELIMRTKTKFSLISVTDCVVYVLSQKKFYSIFYKKYPKLGQAFESFSCVRFMYYKKVVDFINEKMNDAQKSIFLFYIGRCSKNDAEFVYLCVKRLV